ncbi:MAG TPA: DUF1385 domain-containing protein [Acidimicrobiales bacterium]|nr:DUF1385 domain-containing protein [Acidimicrobiales bacterium]
MALKVGGQALVDGVLMRTDRAWAIARADGSIEVGELVERGRLGGVPGLRVLSGIVGGFRLAFARPGRRRTDRKLLWALLGIEAVVVGVGAVLGDVAAPMWAGLLMSFSTLVALRLATPRALWRYHGAEHKAVAAHEAGIDVDDVGAVLRCSRVHNRCGTNLVFVMLLLGVLLLDVPMVLQLPAFAGLLAVCAELVTLAAGRPTAMLSRVTLAGGRAIQRWITTSEPTAAEQAVGCQALLAALAEHARLTAAPAEPLLVAA